MLHIPEGFAYSLWPKFGDNWSETLNMRIVFRSNRWSIITQNSTDTKVFFCKPLVFVVFIFCRWLISKWIYWMYKNLHHQYLAIKNLKKINPNLFSNAKKLVTELERKENVYNFIRRTPVLVAIFYISHKLKAETWFKWNKNLLC